MANGLSVQQTIETLEMSNCGLTNNSSGMIKKIINGHATRRNESVWICGLRGETPQDDLHKAGLRELVLANNKLSDQFVYDILPILSFDQYLRVRNLH